MNRYRPARLHLPASLVAAGLSVFSAWCGMSWPLAFVPAGVFVGWAVILYYFATRHATFSIVIEKQPVSPDYIRSLLRANEGSLTATETSSH